MTQSLSAIETPFNGKMLWVRGEVFVSLAFFLCTASGTGYVLSSCLSKMKEGGLDRVTDCPGSGISHVLGL